MNVWSFVIILCAKIRKNTIISQKTSKKLLSFDDKVVLLQKSRSQIAKTMRVLIVNTSEKTGGAAGAANRLFAALIDPGVKAKMLGRE